MANIKINDVAQRIQYTATNLQTVFSIPFPFFANADLVVYQNSTLLTITTEYTVTGAGTAAGGTLTLVTGATTSDLITIIGELAVDRTSIYSPTISNLTGSSLNNDLNTLTVMQQQAETDRDYMMLRYSPYESVSQTVTTTTDRWIPKLAALQVWQKNAGDTAIEALTLPAIVAGLSANITTDNVLLKTDTSGTNLLQETGVVISDTDVLTGLAGMTVASLVYPTSDGTAGQHLQTDGAGNLSFSSVGTGTVTGPGSSTDNAVARWDGATGLALQNSAVIIDDSDVVTGITQLDVDNMRLDGNTLSATDSNGDMLISANGTGNITVPTNSLTVGDVGGEGSSVTVGGATYDSALKVSDIGGTKVAMDIIHRHSTTLAPLILSVRSNSDTSTPAAVTDGQSLFQLYGAGWDGTDYALAAEISLEVDGTPGANDMPGRITFLTSPDGAQVPVEVMRISQNANVKITGSQDIVHTATEADDHAFEIDVDAAGFGDVKAIDVAYITGGIAAGESEAVMLANIDEAASTGGSVAALEVLTTSIGSATVYGMETFVNVNPVLQSSGSFGNMDSALNIAVDVLAALSSGGAGNITVFVADNDTVTIGDAAKFEEMEIIVDTGASGSGIAPTFEYSDGVGSWVAFTPIDGTNGFRNTGSIAWLVGDLATWAVGTGTEYLIRITRTRNSLGTVPIIDTVQIAATTEYSWNKDGELSVKGVTVADLTASRAVVTDGSKVLTSSATTATEIGYVNGVTSAIQTQIDAINEGATSVQVFTAGGTWTKPAGIKKVIVEVVAGGGGGGGTNNTGHVGGAGGAGGYTTEFIDVTGTASETVTIGAAGAAGSTAGGAGGNGGTSSFGSFCSATGGTGGGAGVAGGVSGSAGGSGSGGDVNIDGEHGITTLSINCMPGGSSKWGAGGASFRGASAGNAGTGYGSGGSPSAQATSSAGGAGAGGLCIVWEYS